LEQPPTSLFENTVTGRKARPTAEFFG